jgi:hypothetical protein
MSDDRDATISTLQRLNTANETQITQLKDYVVKLKQVSQPKFYKPQTSKYFSNSNISMKPNAAKSSRRSSVNADDK